MQQQLLPAFFALLLLAGCSKGSGNNDPSTPSADTPKGGVLFWTSDYAELSTCGALTIVLNNGQQTNITGFYPTAPNNCLNQVGGYMYLPQGQYTYTVATSGGCSIAAGSVQVIGNQCNMFRIP